MFASVPSPFPWRLVPSPSWAPALMSPFSRTASRTLSDPWGPPPRDCVGRGHHSDHLSGQLPHSGLQRPPREADRTRPAAQARRHISWGRALGQDGDPTEYRWLCTTVPSLTLPDEENHVCPLWHSVTGWGPDRKLQLGPAKVRWGTLDAVPGTESFSPMTGKGSSGRVPGSQEGSSPISRSAATGRAGSSGPGLCVQSPGARAAPEGVQ